MSTPMVTLTKPPMVTLWLPYVYPYVYPYGYAMVTSSPMVTLMVTPMVSNGEDTMKSPLLS